MENDNDLAEQLQAFAARGGQVQAIPAGQSAITSQAKHVRVARQLLRQSIPRDSYDGRGRSLDKISYYSKRTTRK